MKIYVDGKRRRFRKSIPNDGQWHTIAATFSGKETKTLMVDHVKASRRKRASEVFAQVFGAGWKKVRP